MAREFPVVDPDEAAEKVFVRLRTSGKTFIAARDNVLHGMLTVENVSEFLLIQAALNGSPIAPPVDSTFVQREAA
jgi:hypothetical protein